MPATVSFRLTYNPIPSRRITHFSVRLNPNSHCSIIKSSLFDYPLASRIMVKNLSYSIKESKLQKEFSKFGQIAEVTLVEDAITKRPKGYAFIQYKCQDDAMLALENMDYKYFEGRLIHVELAKPGKSYNGGYPKTSGPPKEQKYMDLKSVGSFVYHNVSDIGRWES